MSEPVRYRSADEDSARWIGFPFREGDIVISTRSKSGTTWIQMICALLVFQTADLPAPLAELSPWLDWLVAPRDDVYERLAEQQHRRFIKTHTPLDGLPFDPRVTYIVAGRHPLDMAVSLYHQGDNLDRARMRELTKSSAEVAVERPALHTWLIGWIDWDADPREHLDSLPGVLAHMRDAWARRAESNVVLVHYADLLANLEPTMRVLAARLGIGIDDSTWPLLADAATFARMRADAQHLAPDPVGVLKDRARFFRRGTSGAGREALTDGEVQRYYERVAGMGSSELLAWLHYEGAAP